MSLTVTIGPTHLTVVHPPYQCLPLCVSRCPASWAEWVVTPYPTSAIPWPRKARGYRRPVHQCWDCVGGSKQDKRVDSMLLMVRGKVRYW